MSYDYHDSLPAKSPAALTLEGLRNHLNSWDSGDAVDNAYLADQLLVAAWLHCENFLNRTVYPSQAIRQDVEARLAMPDSYPEADRVDPDLNIRNGMVANRAFCQAVLLIVGDWYSNREDGVVQKLSTIPNASKALLWPYRRGLGV